MWQYEKKLQYPVKIANPNPALAKVITSPNATPVEKNNALRTIVDKVVFDRKTSSIEMYYLC